MTEFKPDPLFRFIELRNYLQNLNPTTRSMLAAREHLDDLIANEILKLREIPAKPNQPDEDQIPF